MEQTILFALFILLGLGAWWSFVIFPRQRDFAKRQQYVRSLVPGDEMITYGGIIGKVVSVDGEQGTAEIEIAPGVVVRMVSIALVQPYEPEKLAESARKTQ